MLWSNSTFMYVLTGKFSICRDNPFEQTLTLPIVSIEVVHPLFDYSFL